MTFSKPEVSFGKNLEATLVSSLRCMFVVLSVLLDQIQVVYMSIPLAAIRKACPRYT